MESLGRSDIPSPVARSGYSLKPAVRQVVTYDGQPLPRFLLDNGCDPTGYRLFMQINRIARIWDLQRGQAVVLPPQKNDDFAVHPDR